MSTTCDTSVLVPALVAWHPDHEEIRERMEGVGTIGAHVLLETYSVLTRLPAPHRIAPAEAQAVVERIGLDVIGLPSAAQRALIPLFGAHGVRGGAVYDALVAATARHHALTLITRDRRARATYDVVGASYTLV